MTADWEKTLGIVTATSSGWYRGCKNQVWIRVLPGVQGQKPCPVSSWWSSTRTSSDVMVKYFLLVFT